ncbi:glycosyltransferase [Ruminococcus sp.]|uniref:glycosyltransferase n=1 Tax=Ruminococcus sp. TaxID=41978 RepID=UPI0025E019F4|nr:glycosyltransferase [Ruminococcus sp.]
MKTNESPLVTVVTACYKNFTHIYETISSVLKQNYPKIEYIICDDGSAEFPEEQIRKYVDEHKHSLIDFVIIHHTQNIGTVRNLNSAYKSGKGQYFINLSCGDVFFERDTVSKIVKAFIVNKADVVVTSRILYHNDYDPVCLLPHINERKIIKSNDTSLKQYKALILGQAYDMASGSAMSYSREIMKKYDFFDESYVLWEDGPFLIKYLWENKLCFAYDIISIWYEDGGTSSGSLHPKLVQDTILYNKTERIKHTEILNSEEKKQLSYQIGNFYLTYAGKNSKAKKALFCLRHLCEYLFYRRIFMERKKRIQFDDSKLRSLKYDLFFLDEKKE